MTEPGMALLANVELPLNGQPLSKASGLLLSDIFLIAAVAVALLLVLLFWASYLRKIKLRKPRSDGKRVYRDSTEAEEAKEAEAQNETRRRYKYRYRRRDHRSRNPTLAETGGLPPERADGRVEPSH